LRKKLKKKEKKEKKKKERRKRRLHTIKEIQRMMVPPYIYVAKTIVCKRYSTQKNSGNAATARMYYLSNMNGISFHDDYHIQQL